MDECNSKTTNVQVCARIRPLVKTNQREFFFKSSSPRKSLSFITGGKHSNRRKSGSPSKSTPTNSQNGVQGDNALVAWDISENRTTVTQSNKTEKIQGRTHAYTLDKVFGTDTDTDEIYEESVSPLVNAAMEGYNSTVLAYGQTSTGKTHTMTGKKNAPGLIPLCIRDCFKYVKENNSDEPREYLFRFSYLEIYKEHIRDLLSASSSAPEPVRLFDGPSGLIIRGLKEEVVSSPEKVFKLLKQGEKRRQVGATYMNQHSSRSHVVMRLKIESSVASKTSGETRVSLLTLVDLAGSESVRLNGAERRDEGQYINKSLMALGQCVLGLSETIKNDGAQKKSRSHIPYRDSKLTRLLQSSLSGNAQMLLMCCISPLVSHMEESHNTFKFATRAKRIEQTATIQMATDNEETLLQTYRDEIEDLRKQLAEATQQQQKLLEDQRAYQVMKEHKETLQTPSAVGTVSAPIPTPNTNSSKTSSYTVESTTEEIDELVEAIQTMEQLILKNRSLQQQQTSNQFTSRSQEMDGSVDLCLSIAGNHNELEEVLDLLQSNEVKVSKDRLGDGDTASLSGREKNELYHIAMESPYSITTTPFDSQKNSNNKDQIHSELTRIRGLLGSVLKKRGVTTVPSKDFSHEIVSKSLDFSSPSRRSYPLRQRVDQSLSDELNAGMNIDGSIDEFFGDVTEKVEEKKAELESLRMQLEQQERTTSLRKADSYFLQSQLEEKNKLLEEVSSLLEALEKRQGELERENLELKRELNMLQEQKGYEV